MTRDTIPSATGDALLGAQLAPIGLVELSFDSGVFRMWTGFGNLEWNAYTWYGAGLLGSISAIEETTETRAAGVELSLSGVGSDVLEIALRETWQGRDSRIYYAVLDTNNQFVGEPFQIRRGLMDVMELSEGDTCEIKLRVESRDIDLGRAKSRRYTAEDQRAAYAGDAGCDQVAALQEKEVKWAA